jgi:hypothetical protein
MAVAGLVRGRRGEAGPRGAAGARGEPAPMPTFGPEQLSASAFESVTRERVDGISRQLDRVELKLNGVFIALVGASLTEVYRVVTGH